MCKVIIISSPVTERYVRSGSEGWIDSTVQQIRVGGVWFEYDQDRWKVENVDDANGSRDTNNKS